MGTMTSAFLLTLQFECALTIFLTVARGYSFWPGILMFKRRVVSSGEAKQIGFSMVVLLIRGVCSCCEADFIVC